MLRTALLLLPSLVFLWSCGKPPGHPGAVGEDTVSTASLKSDNARLGKELKQERDGFEKRQRESIRKNEELVKENDLLKSKIEKAQDEAVKAVQDLATYTAKVKASWRAKTKGMALPKIETAEKVAFEKVVIRELTPTEVAFSHAGGVARIPLAKLTRDLQEKLLYDPGEVETLAKAEAEGAAVMKEVQQLGGVTVRDPTGPVNSLAVRNLTKRIVTREEEIVRLEKEAREVKASAYGETNIAQYRVQQLGLRVTQLKTDITALRKLLEKELTGPPQAAGGPSERNNGAE